MEGEHERSAGEWQIEWLAVPQVAKCTAATLKLAGQIAGSLEVFPEVMAANVTKSADLLLSEALMIRLAPLLGRNQAHHLVYHAAIRSRLSGQSLLAACRDELDTETLSQLDREPIPKSAEEYIGAAPQIAEAAVTDWAVRKATMAQVPAENVAGSAPRDRLD